MRKEAVALIIFAFLIFNITAVSAAFVGPCGGGGSCSPSQLGTTQTVLLQNGCGGNQYTCVSLQSCVGAPLCRQPVTYTTLYCWKQTASCTVNSDTSNSCCSQPCGFALPGTILTDQRYSTYDQCTVCGGNGDLRGQSKDSPCTHLNQTGGCYQGKCWLPPYVFAFSTNISDRNAPLMITSSGLGLDSLTGKRFTFIYGRGFELSEIDFKVCRKDNLSECYETKTNLSGESFVENWTFPSDLLFWLDENARSYTLFDVKMNVTNVAGQAQEMGGEIYGEDLPVINSSVSSSSLQFGQKIVINADVTERLSGVQTVQIFTDNALAQSCSTAHCSYEYVPNEGAHTYNVTSMDKAGNIQTYSGSFSVATVEKTCSEIGGAMCGDNERCTNDQYAKTSDTERCCTSSCYSSELNITCSSQNGIIFDPSVKDCSAEIPATDTIDPNRCCAVQPVDKLPPQEESVYWTDSMGNRIFGTGLQESVECKATGIVNNLQILKEGNVISEKTDTQLPITVSELGTYVCNANYTDGNEKEASLSVAEVPAPNLIVRARLPGFGFAQFLAALSMISAYYMISIKKRK